MRQICVITSVCMALVVFCAFAPNFGDARQELPPKDNPEKVPPKEKPLTYRAEKSGILFYVESDRQHMAAIDKDGKVLWHKNIIDQVRGKERLGWPARIVVIDKPHDGMLEVMKHRGKDGDYVGIALSTKEFGVLNQSSGVFTSLGTD